MNNILQWATGLLSGIVDASTLVRDALMGLNTPKSKEAASRVEQAYGTLSGERYAALAQGAISPQQFQEECLKFLTALQEVVRAAQLPMGEKFDQLIQNVRTGLQTIPEPITEAEPPKLQAQSAGGPPPMLFIVGLLGMAGLGYWAWNKMKKDKPKPSLAERLEAQGDEDGDSFDGLEEYEDVEGERPEEMVDPHEEGGITIVKG